MSGSMALELWRTAGSRRSTSRRGWRARAPGNTRSPVPKTDAMTTATPYPNADPAELAKFSALAHRWWDPGSEFRPLHEINPLRLTWIERVAGGLQGKAILDVGCGGGILSEAMASAGARVTGIDLSEKALGVAQLHQLES